MTNEIINQHQIDRNNGKKMFQPDIIAKNISPRETNELGNYMYNFSSKFSMKKTQQSMAIREDFKKKSNTIHTRGKSNDLFNQMKMKAFKKIFELLDGDEDKLISIYCVSLNRLPESVRKLIQPIVTKMKEENCAISMSEFFEYCDLIYESLTKDNKYILLNFDKKMTSSKSSEKLKPASKKKTLTNFSKTNSNSFKTFNLVQPKKQNSMSQSMVFDPMRRCFVKKI